MTLKSWKFDSPNFIYCSRFWFSEKPWHGKNLIYMALKVILCKINMLTPPPPPPKRGLRNEKKKYQKKKRKLIILTWKLNLGPFEFFKAQILAWNKKRLEERICCIIYWPEGPFLNLLTMFFVLTNQLLNRKIFLERFHIFWLMVKVPKQWRDCSNSLDILQRAARPPKKKSISNDIKSNWQGIVNSQLFMLFLRSNSSLMQLQLYVPYFRNILSFQW